MPKACDTLVSIINLLSANTSITRTDFTRDSAYWGYITSRSRSHVSAASSVYILGVYIGAVDVIMSMVLART